MIGGIWVSVDFCTAVLVAGDYQNERDFIASGMEIQFKTSLAYVVGTAHQAGSRGLCIVDGNEKERYASGMEDYFWGEWGSGYHTGQPWKQLFIFARENASDLLLILFGYTPLLQEGSLEQALDHHQAQFYPVTRLFSAEDTVGYIFDRQRFLDAFSDDGAEPLSKTLSDLADVLDEENGIAGRFAVSAEEAWTVHAAGVLDIQNVMKRRILNRLIREGVIFHSADGVMIHPDVRIGKGTAVYPGTILKAGVEVGEDCILGPNTLVLDSKVGNTTTLNASQVYHSAIGDRVAIGPFCHIRPNSTLKDDAKIGDFVEVKNSVIGESTHISHLTYVGDSDVGANVNFGCGCVTVNFDGKQKHRCTIGDNAFIGCNTNLVAPVTVGRNGYTAAGSTITQDVPADSLAIARARQVNKEGYAKGRTRNSD